MTTADRLLVLYASQTGNSEWIAKNIDEQARERGFASRCLSMDAAADEVRACHKFKIPRSHHHETRHAEIADARRAAE